MVYPDPTHAPEEQTATVTVAMTLWGEARGEPTSGVVAVACVLQNRVMDPKHRYGVGWKGVCLRPWAFSCWNPMDANYQKLLKPLAHGGPLEWQICASTAAAAIGPEGLEDIVDGANHYYNRYSMPPHWAAAMVRTAVIGRHVFLRSED